MAWQDLRNNNDDIYLQHVTGSGEIAPGWLPDGIPVCTDPQSQFLGISSSDGMGGVILVWYDARNSVPGGTSRDIYAQRILANGAIAPGWPVDGAPVTRAPGRQEIPYALADDQGGAFFTWDDEATLDIYAQHLGSDGTPVPGWPANGLPVCTESSLQGGPQLAPDGTRGAFVAWGDLRDGPLGVYAQRVTRDGQIVSGWPANGIRVVPGRAIRQLMSDGVGGAYLSCSTRGSSQDGAYYLQRFAAEGAIVAGWPEGGAPVTLSSGDRAGIRMAPDASGGALLAWTELPSDDEIFAMRMRSDGSSAPGWPTGGLPVTSNTVFDDGPEIASDETGGAYLCWDRVGGPLGSNDRVITQHLTGSAGNAPGWPANGREILSDISSGMMVITEDGLGGAVVAWHRSDNTIRALRLGPDGPVAVQISLVSAEAEPGLARLTWFAADGSALSGTVERRTATTEWEPLAEASFDGDGRLIYEDRAVAAGIRYAYRLGYRDGSSAAHTSEIWVTVPALAFGLHRLAPNPSEGDPLVSFSLAHDEPAWLEMFDLRGRLVHSREVGSLGPGAHEVRLGQRGALRAGVYSVRLRQGPRVAIARAVIIQ